MPRAENQIWHHILNLHVRIPRCTLSLFVHATDFDDALDSQFTDVLFCIELVWRTFETEVQR